MFAFGKNRDGNWGGNDISDHMAELMDALQFLYGNRFTFVFIFDWSSGHAKCPPGALNVNVMQVNFGDKQERNAKLNPTTIVEDYAHPPDFSDNLPKLK